MSELTHINDQGRARMVEVSDKDSTRRIARAAGCVVMRPDTLELVRTGGAKKGDVLAVAQVAGIMAAKRCHELIPMCHNLMLTGVDIAFAYLPEGIRVEATCSCLGQTGVEMEALTAASVAALTIYDMLKAYQRDMVIERIELIEKSGGKSGHFVRTETHVQDAFGADGFQEETSCTTATQACTDDAEHTCIVPNLESSPAEPQVSVHKTFPASQPRVLATCMSPQKGTKKQQVAQLEIKAGHGIVGDAHAGSWHRQVSLLPFEATEELMDILPQLAPGDFAENILVEGISLKDLPLGTILKIGTATLVVTQIGKTCHTGCEIAQQTGRCIMPTEGIFCVCATDGIIKPGDVLSVVDVEG